MLSPSKATDLMHYFRSYPEWPLRIDLLIDFLMYPQLLVPQPGTPIVVRRDVAKSRWERAFDDLVYAGAIALPETDYMSFDEEVAWAKFQMKEKNRDLINDPLDFALTIRHAQREEVPLKYRAQDVELLQKGEYILNGIYSQWGYHPEPNSNLEAEGEDESRVARWMFQVQLPRIFARRDNETEQQLQTYLRWQPNEAVWIQPDELARLLKEREPIDQFRPHAQELAALGYDDRQTSAYIAEQRYRMEKKLKVGDFIFDGFELALDAIPLALKVAAKIVKRLVTGKANQPYRWLLATSEVDAKAADDRP